MTGTARSMFRVAGLLVSASVVRNVGQVVLLVLIARLLGVEAVGTYTVALAICAPVYIIAGFGMRTVFLTLRRTIRPETYERFLLSTVGAAFALIVLISALLPPEIGHVLLVIAAIRTGEVLFDLYDAMLQRGERPGTIVALGAVGTGLQVVASGTVLLAGGTLVQALIASFLVYILNLLVLARPRAMAAARSVEQIDPVSQRPWRHIFAAGLPTGVAVGMITLLSTVPQYLLAVGEQVADAGRFAVVLYTVVATEMLLHALAQSWMPHARRMLLENRLTAAAVARMGLLWVLIAGSLGLLGLGAAAIVLPLALGPEFSVSPAVAVPLALGILLVPCVFVADTAIVVHNRYALSMTVSLSALVLGTALGLTLLQLDRLDLVSALWTFTATMAVRALGGALAVLMLSARRLPEAPTASAASVKAEASAPGSRRSAPGSRRSATGARRSGLRAALRRHWMVIAACAVTVAAVAAGPRWSLGAAAAVAVLCVLALLRLRATELLVMTVPLAMYVQVGPALLNLAVSDLLLVLLLIRIVTDPQCAEAFAQVSGQVRAALSILSFLLVLMASTTAIRSVAGAPVDWFAFAADALKLIVVMSYFVACLVIFRHHILGGDHRFLMIWAHTAAAVGGLGILGSILFAAGVDLGLTMDFRATSTFEDPNAFATYLLLSIPITMAARHLAGRPVLSWHLLPVLGGIYVSFSRGALLGLAAVLLALGVFALRHTALRVLRFGALLVLGAAVWFIASGGAGALLSGGRGGDLGDDVRFSLWSAAVEVWLHSPVFGVGLGQFVTASSDLLGPAGGILAHQTYLSILAEGGVVGAGLYLAVPVMAAHGLLRRGDTVSVLLLASGVAAGVMAMSLNLQNFRPIWIFLALAVAWTADSPLGRPPRAAQLAAASAHRRGAADHRTFETRTDRSWN